MVKKLKIFLIALLMIPCVFMMSACNFFKKDPSLTTSQKNEAYGKLKSVLNQDYSAKSEKATVVSTSTQAKSIKSIDLSQSTLPSNMQSLIKSYLEGSSYEKCEFGYNNDGTGYMTYKSGTNAQSATTADANYFVKDGTKIVNYNLSYVADEDEESYIFDEINAQYVSPEHCKYEVVNAYLGSLDSMKEATVGSETFSDFVKSMNRELTNTPDDTTTPTDIVVDVDMSEKDNVYSISGSFTMTNFTMNLEDTELNVNGSAEYLIKFTENALLQYSMSNDLEFNVELPDVIFDMEGTGSFSVVMKNSSSENIVLTETFDESKMISDFSEYGEIEQIDNAIAEATFYIDGYEFSTHRFDFAEGFTLADANNSYDPIDFAEITWYNDENCTTPISGTITGKSFGSINLYAKDVAVPAGYAAVIVEFEDDASYSYYELEYQNTYDFYNTEYYNIYVTIDNGIRTLHTEESLALEEGKTYKIEYVYSYEEEL